MSKSADFEITRGRSENGRNVWQLCIAGKEREMG